VKSRAARIGLYAFGLLGFGYFALGPILYSLFIGLDWAAYPGGRAIESLFRGLGYTGNNAISGVFWLLLGLLAAMAFAFVAARARVRSDTDPSRRRLLHQRRPRLYLGRALKRAPFPRRPRRPEGNRGTAPVSRTACAPRSTDHAPRAAVPRT